MQIGVDAAHRLTHPRPRRRRELLSKCYACLNGGEFRVTFRDLRRANMSADDLLAALPTLQGRWLKRVHLMTEEIVFTRVRF